MSNDLVKLEWERPSGSYYHAHWDCFSGAAGDMMLAACVDASGDGAPALLSYIQHCLEGGLPELRGEFSLEVERVWRGEIGSIAASYVAVKSRYQHAAAPVPGRISGIDEKKKQHEAEANGESEQSDPYEHDHSHDHGHSRHHGHSHEHNSSSLEVGQDTKDQPHSHSHHDHENKPTHTSISNSSHSHHHKHASGPLRNLPQIREMLLKAPTSCIPEWVRDRAIEAFTELAKAEAMTHGADSPDSVHFHEVGAIDSIVDIVGTLIAMDCLGIKTVSCSPLPLGQGTVWTDHGLLPVPAPATLRLLVDMPTCPGPPGITGELVTPTAAALLKVLTNNSTSKIPGRAPCFTIRKVGIGAGTKDFVKHPNILRLMIGDNVVRDDRTYL